MEIDTPTIIALGGVASLLVERFFYYKSRYKNRKDEKPDNPGHGERIRGLETGLEALEKNNEKDHELIRRDIRKLFNLLNGMRK